MIEDFECIECGHCYRTLSVGPWNFVEDIRDLPPLNFEDDYLPCKYLNLETNKCKIQDSKPDACRNYPHTLEFAIQTGCNGYYKGKKLADGK